MRKMLKMSIACAVIMGAGAVSAQADNVDILSNVKANGEIRARYEMVDATDTTGAGGTNKPNANALTNRLVLGVSADMFGTDWLSAYAEMTNVSALNNNYDDKYAGNGVENNDVVADSKQTRLTQSYIDLKYGKTKLRVGRQIINLDNQRFVGAVDWRQMPQTFDAYTLTDNTIDNLNLTASYITQINRVFNQDTTLTNTNGAIAGAYDTRSLLLNASYKVMNELKVTVYDYMIGQGTGKTDGTGGSDTYGIALTGDIAAADGIKVNYRAEYAKQTDPTMENKSVTGNINVDANYYDLELGANISGILVGAQYEVLSGTNGTDGNTAFATPLATLHAHNGWADMFLGTPTKGLVDMNLMVGYTSKEIGTAKVVYHDYTSDVGSKDWGTELDVVYTRAIPGVNNLTGMLKYANYSADSSTKNTAFVGTNMNIDTSKFIAMLDYKFATK